jgi:bifunctional enzyme CysN/CysC
LAEGVCARLEGERVEVLDGDVLRSSPLSDDLGFSTEDRLKQARRTAFLAQRLNAQDVVCLVALVSPSRAARQAARDLIPRFVEVFVQCSVEECQRRDPKGLYARARAGELKGLTGYDASYEPPETPDLVLDTSTDSVETCVCTLAEEIRGRLAEIRCSETQ